MNTPISKEVEAFMSKCFKDGIAVGINPLFKVKYNIEDEIYVFNETILEEMLSTGRCKLINRDEKSATIIGIEGEDLWD